MHCACALLWRKYFVISAITAPVPIIKLSRFVAIIAIATDRYFFRSFWLSHCYAIASCITTSWQANLHFLALFLASMRAAQIQTREIGYSLKANGSSML